MNKRNHIMHAAVAAAFATIAGTSFATATINPVGAITTDFAKETCMATTVFTLPNAVYTMGVSANQDFYVTYTLTNATFASAPTAAHQNSAGNAATPGTATLVDGGTAGASTATFRMNGASQIENSTDTITLSGITAKATSCASPITVGAANGLLFLSGSVGSPLEAVTAAPNAMATFTNAVTITMATDSDVIDLNPSSGTSRTVFGPSASLDVATIGGTVNESNTALTRVASIVIGTQKEPNGSNAFASSIDSLTVSLTTSTNFTGISSLCFDANRGGTCDAGENMTLTGTSTSVTIPASSWSSNANNGLILNKTAGALFDPRTLTVSYALNVAANGVRNGLTAQTYAYTVANNTWPIQYANGTLLRSDWFLVDANASSTVRLVNASANLAPVVSATYYLDSGATGNFLVADLVANAGKNIPINATLIPALGTGTASRGYIEMVIAGDLTNVEGHTISNGSIGRTVIPMRNVTFDSGVRTGTSF